MPLTLRRLALAAALALGVLLALPSPATAHVTLVASSPRDGAVLAAEPHQVDLVFSGEVSPALTTVTVIGPSGRRLDSAPPTPTAPDRLAVRLTPDPHPGPYVVTWRTTTTSGALTFSTTSPGNAPAQPAPPHPNRTTDAFRDATAALALSGLSLLVGFTAFRLYCLREPQREGSKAESPVESPAAAAGMRAGDGTGSVPGRTAGGVRWPAAVGWGAVLGGTVGELLLLGPAGRGEPVTHGFHRALLSASLSSHDGHTLVARIMLLALVAAVGEQVLRHRVAGGAAVAVAAPLLALTWSETGHAASGGLALAVTTLHVTAMAVWAGGTATVAVLLARRTPDAGLDAAVARFSRLTLWCVAALAATGVYLAHRETGVGDLTRTHYGTLLLAKTALFLLLAAAATLTRTRPSRPRTPAALRRSVLLEFTGLTAVVVLGALLAGTPPPGP